MKLDNTLSNLITLLVLGGMNIVPVGASRVEARNELGCAGTATPYQQFGVAGSCGQFHSDGDYVAALSPAYMPGSCGRQVRIHNYNNGRSVTATVADTCPGCAGSCHIDLSEGAFSAIANLADGWAPNVSWEFI